MDNLAPIVLFVYNRPSSTLKTLNALKKNKYAVDSVLYIYSDGPKSENDVEDVLKVRKIISNIDGFKKVKIINSDKNKGLGNSVILGVSEVLKKHGKIIVLEDDLVTSKNFLSYMNKALNYYKDKNDIWSISGYTPEIKFPESYQEDIYMVKRGCSWGWATWSDRWDLIDWEVKDYLKFKSNSKLKEEFNNSGNDLTLMLDNQMNGRIDSWAIRWVYNQFKNNSFTIYPKFSYIKNIGMDGKGTHGSISNNFTNDLVDFNEVNLRNITFNKEINEEFRKVYNLKIYNYIGYSLRKLGLYKVTKKVIKRVLAFNRQ